MRDGEWWGVLCGGLVLFGNLAFAAEPINDHFAGRQILSGVSVAVEVPFGQATREPGEPQHGGLPGSHSLWWSWIAPFRGELSLQGSGGEAAPIIAVYRGNSLAGLSMVKNNNPSAAFVPDGELRLIVQGGEELQIAVDTPDLFLIPDVGELRLTFSPPPVNDAFAGRFPVGTLPATVEGESRTASIEAGEPHLFPNAADHSLWWSWTPTTAGRVILTNLSRGFMNVAIFRGESVSNLQVIASRELNYSTDTSAGGSLVFDALAGTPYSLRLDATDPRDAGLIRFSLTTVDPPANDNFANRIVLAGTNLTVWADNVAALSEPGEGPHFSGAVGRTLWWSWTAPYTGRLTLDTRLNAYIHLVAYEGESISRLVRVDASGIPAGYSYFNVVGGRTYQLVVDAGVFPGAFQFQLNLEARTPNDDFEARKILEGTSLVEAFRTAATSRESGEPKLQKNAPGHSLWWMWTAPGDGLLELNTPGQVGLFTGETLRRLRAVEIGERRVIVPVRSGQTYQIMLDAPETLGTREWTLSFYGKPANDSPAQPTMISGSDVRFYGDTRGATQSSGEPRLHARSRGTTVWYSWTAPEDGNGLLRRISSGFTAVLGVYRKEASGRLTKISSVAGIPDYPYRDLMFPVSKGRTYLFGVDVMPYDDPDAGGGFEVRLLFSTLRLANPTEGMVVHDADTITFSITPPLAGVDGDLARVDYVRAYVDGGWETIASASNAPFAASVTGLPTGTGYYAALAETTDGQQRFTPANTVTVRPENDDFANRRVMAGYAWAVQSRTDGATVEKGEPSAGGGASMWYSWTAPASGPVTLTFGRERSAKRLTAHTGDTLRGLKSVKLKPLGADTMRLNAVEGKTYHFAVRDSSGPLRDPGQVRSFQLGLELETLRMIQPLNGTVFVRTTDVALSAFVTDQSASDTRVEYYSGTNLVAISTAPPYTAVWSNAPAGVFDLAARLVINSVASPLCPPVQIVVRPLNDNFADASPIPGSEAHLFQSTRSGTREPSEPVHSIRNLPQSVWWKWVAPADGAVLVKGEVPPGTVSSPECVLYTGDSLGTLSPVARINPNPNSGIPPDESNGRAFAVVAGRTYFLAAAEATGSDLELTLKFRPPPSNDRFETRVPVEGESAQLTGWTINAESQPDWPAHAVWWTWRAPRNGLVRISTVMLPGEFEAAVYTGNSIGEFQSVPLLTAPEVIVAAGFRTVPPRQPPVPALVTLAAFQVRAGVDYHVMVSDSSGDSFGFELDFQFNAASPNDDFAASQPLEGSPITFTVDNENAGTEPAEPNRFPFSVWYTWIAPSSGVLRIVNPATPPAPAFAAYRGEELAQLRPAALVSSGDGYRVEAGERYHIAIGTAPESFGRFPCHLEVLPMAANDNFSGRSVVDGVPVELVGSLPASDEDGEPLPAYKALPSWVSWGRSSLWWSWTAPRDGRVEVTFEGNRWAHQVGVFEGTELADLRQVYPDLLVDGAAFDAVGGRVYQIAGYSGLIAGPEFRGRIDMPATPVNDLFVNRSLLTGEHVSVVATNWGATTEVGEPSASENRYGRTLWYSWTAPHSGRFVIKSATTNFILAFRIYLGTELGHLTPRYISNTRIEFPVTGGQELQISVDGLNGEGGTFSFDIDLEPVAIVLANRTPANLPPAPAPGLRSIYFSGEPGASYRIETSTNLKDWSVLSTNRLLEPVGVIEEPEIQRWPARFYRVTRIE